MRLWFNRGGSGHASLNRERGAVLVEAAIVMPVILFIVLGAIDYGLLFRDDLTITNMTRAGARSGSAVGNGPMADYNALATMASAGAALQGGVKSINYVVIFKADCTPGACDPGSSQTPPIATVPAVCTTAAAVQAGGVGGLCNVYSSSYLLTPGQHGNLSVANFGCVNGARADAMWCPTTRAVSENNDDYLGVYINLTHSWITGFFGKTKTVTDAVVFRLEPQSFT